MEHADTGRESPNRDSNGHAQAADPCCRSRVLAMGERQADKSSRASHCDTDTRAPVVGIDVRPVGLLGLWGRVYVPAGQTVFIYYQLVIKPQPVFTHDTVGISSKLTKLLGASSLTGCLFLLGDESRAANPQTVSGSSQTKLKLHSRATATHVEAERGACFQGRVLCALDNANGPEKSSESRCDKQGTQGLPPSSTPKFNHKTEAPRP